MVELAGILDVVDMHPDRVELSNRRDGHRPHLSPRNRRGFERLFGVPKPLQAGRGRSSDDFLHLAEPWFRCADLGSFLPRPPLWDGLKRSLQLSDSTLDPPCELCVDFCLRCELAEPLWRLRTV